MFNSTERLTIIVNTISLFRYLIILTYIIIYEITNNNITVINFQQLTHMT